MYSNDSEFILFIDGVVQNSLSYIIDTSIFLTVDGHQLQEDF